MQRTKSLLLVAALATTATAQILVTPNGYANTVGNTNNTYPWARGTASMRIQFLVDSTHFTLQGATSPIVISNLRYRPYSGAVTTWAGGSWPNVRIDMATSPLDWAAASTTFASNLGPDLTTVHNGAVTVTGGTTGGVGVVVPWHINIPLATPFVYDPTSGNDLTIDIYLDGTGWTGTSRAADHVSGATALGCRVYDAGGIAGSTGVVTTSYGPVTEFTWAPAAGYASAAAYGTGCINSPDVSSYELFASSAAFDLDNTAITFVPTGTGYLAIPGTATYLPPSGTATTLVLADDAEISVPLVGSFPIGSGSTNQLTVCSNGFVSSGPGNGTGFTPAPAAFLNSAKAWWSLAWHDFNPSIVGSGQVKFEQIGSLAYVTWDGVWDYGGSGPANASTFQAQFDLGSGMVHYVFQTVSDLGNNILTGFSNAGPSPDPGSMDISVALPGSYTAAVFAITPLVQAASARPVIGTSISLLSSNIPAAGVIGLQVYGLTEFTTGVDLTSLGMPGCRLYASLDAMLTFLPAGGAGSSLLPIPPNTALAGMVILTQSAALVPGVNAFGAIASNGVRLTLNVN